MSVTSSGPVLDAPSSAVWYLEKGVGVREKDERLDEAAMSGFS